MEWVIYNPWFDALDDKVLVGKEMGTLSAEVHDTGTFSTHYKLQKSVAVTAFIRTESVAYVAHGRTVSRLLDLSQTAMRAEGLRGDIYRELLREALLYLVMKKLRLC